MALTWQQRSGRAGQNDQVFCKWPPRSPDLIICDFFLWGYVKDRVYVPPLPATVDELQVRITAAVKSFTTDTLQGVWSELDYHIDLCRVTRVGTLSMCETTWNSMRLCNFSHQFFKNIPVSFDFIATWYQGLFLCSACIYRVTQKKRELLKNPTKIEEFIDRNWTIYYHYYLPFKRQ